VASLSKVTVIGGSGFVGTNLCKKLAEQNVAFEIIDLKQSVRFPSKCKLGDVRDIDSLRKTVTGDIILNLAAVHRDDVRDKNEYYRTNVEGAGNVAKISSEKGIKKIVFTSSVAVYGFATADTDEHGEINPFNEYGKTKYLAELKLRDWEAASGNKLIIVRPTVIFGEGNRGNVYNLLSQISSGKFLMVGSGNNCKSMAYVENVVSFIEKCLETDKKFAVYNYVDTPDMNMNSLVRQVRSVLKGKDSIGPRIPQSLGILLGYLADGVTRISGKNLPISSIRVKKFCASTSFKSAKESLDGFKPPFTLQEGIERTLHSEFIEPDPDREIFYTE
jgi:GlcNAc-P-P-Und epimerase